MRATVFLLAAGILAALLTVPIGGRALAVSSPDSRTMATWNMNRSSDRWDKVAELSQSYSVVALQEASTTPPAGTSHEEVNGNLRTFLWLVSGTPDRNPVYRYLTILDQSSRNLAMVTNFHPSRVLEMSSVYRSALGIVDDQNGQSTLYASVHASASPPGSDAAALVNTVRANALQQGLQYWVALGDFNRDPGDLSQQGQLPAGASIYNSGQTTFERGGRELDYMVSNVETQNWPASVLTNSSSDHWPVGFSPALAGAGLPPDLTIQPANTSGVTPLGSFLGVSQSRTANGTHVILWHPDGGSEQHWKLVPIGAFGTFFQPLYRIVSDVGGNCLDVNNGWHSHSGDYLNVWDCHQYNGAPAPGGVQGDTQNFTLVQPNLRFPDQFALRDNGTGEYVNVQGNHTGDGTWMIQWPSEYRNGTLTPNELFYLHPGE